MARLFNESFEAGHFLRFGSTSGAAITTSTPIDGLRSFGASSGAYGRAHITASSEIYVAEFYRFSSISGTTAYILDWRNGTTELGSIRINRGLGSIEAYRGAFGSETLVATTGSILSDNITYHFQVRIKIDDAVGAIEILKDNTSALSFAGDTKPGADTTIDRVTFYQVSNGERFDDCVINDTTGSIDNTWPGVVRFKQRLPVGIGTYVNNWSRNTGSTNWEQVDEVPHDSDTTYLSTTTSSIYESFSMSPHGLANADIRALLTSVIIRKDSGNSKLIVGIRDNDNSTDYMTPAQNLGVSYGLIEERRTVDPSTTVAFTLGGANANQALIVSSD